MADTLVTEVFLRFGVPRYQHSDQAPEFMSELMSELCELLKLQSTHTTPYRPQTVWSKDSTGPLSPCFPSSVVRNIMTGTSTCPFLCVRTERLSMKALGFTPNLLMLGREITLPMDLMYPPNQHQVYKCHNEYVEWLKCALQDSFETARQNLGVASERQKRYYNMHTKHRQYQVGDFVLRFYPPNLKDKLNRPYISPCRVMAKLGDVTYRIQKTPKSKPLVVHVDHLKLFHTDTPLAGWSTPTGTAKTDTGVDASDQVGCDDHTVSVSDDDSEVDSDARGSGRDVHEAAEGSRLLQFPRRSIQKRSLPGWLRDYDMA